MALEREWGGDSDRSASAGSGSLGPVHIALIFGSVAVALALILAPLLADYAAPRMARTEIDSMATGSIGKRDGYVIRRSVLQSSPTSVCIIRADGRRSGDC